MGDVCWFYTESTVQTKKLYLSARHVIVVVWAIHAFSQITFKGVLTLESN